MRIMYAVPQIPIAGSHSTNLATGHSSLPPSCPVCEHSPLSADDCTPNKSLRTTIKVLLRTAEKKREASRPKEPQEPAPAPATESQNDSQSTVPLSGVDTGSSATLQSNGASQAPTEHEHSIQDPKQQVPEDPNKVDHHQELPLQTATVLTSFAQKDSLGASAEPTNAQAVGANGNDDAANVDEEDDDESDDDDDVIITTKRQEPPVKAEPEDEEEEQGDEDDNGEGLQNENGFQNNMMFQGGGGDYNQMQMMMAMQNNMGFPMMGMC